MSRERDGKWWKLINMFKMVKHDGRSLEKHQQLDLKVEIIMALVWFVLVLLDGRREFLRVDVEFQGFGKGVYECEKMAETFANKYKWKSLSNTYDKYVCAYTGTCLYSYSIVTPFWWYWWPILSMVVYIRTWQPGPDGPYSVTMCLSWYMFGGCFIHPWKLIKDCSNPDSDYSEPAPKAAKDYGNNS